jgi:hypothetical protein
MPYDPTTIPPMDGRIRRGVFVSTIHRKPTLFVFRGVEFTGRVSEPSFQRKIGISGYTEQTADLELMMALPAGSPKPEPNSADSITIYETDDNGLRTTSSVYRITDVRTDLARDCYQLTLSKRRT